MILSGEEIKKRLGTEIMIRPFDASQINPNSYNLRLSPTLLVYLDDELDVKQKPRTREIVIPESGYVLEPFTLYLGSTIEYTETYGLIPRIDGRSSLGRLGLFIHITAGFGDIGFKGFWTLELMCVKPLRVYPGVKICQISYHTTSDLYSLYQGKYSENTGVQASKLYLEYQK